MISQGAYCLCIKVDKEISLEIGALGSIKFPRGKYVYVGSAMNGLDARLRRHINTSRGVYRAIHWHIDYLLRDETVRIETVYIQEARKKTECAIADAISKRGTPVKGFGSSDCGCSTHLFRVDTCLFMPELGMERKQVSRYYS